MRSLSNRQMGPRGPAGVDRAISQRSTRRLALIRAHQQHKVDVECSTSTSVASSQQQHPRRALLGLAAAAAAAAITLQPLPAAADALAAASVPADATPYLLSTGAKGLLAEEEARLLQLRKELEAQVRKEIELERAAAEKDAQSSAVGKLCATPYGVDIVGITEFIALVGALVGGITARQRKNELERLNEQLRKVNMSLRQQARAGMVYAPGLTYVPPTAAPGSSNGNGNGYAPAAPVVAVAAPAGAAVTVTAPPKPKALEAAAAPAAGGAVQSLFSMDEDEMTSDQIQCRDSLRAGKRLLKEKNGAAAMVRFEKALMLSKALEDKVQERRAMRGLAASARLQGQYKAAIKHLERVLEISREMKEFTGDADAYGTIADCYTEMGDFEHAAVNYDKYIRVMNTDGPV
ncbi:hypothetical protein MNEG_1119 [Monoraphidium neglectum]|uniref:Uncharacterized protein n=1 Tax=Monoraphidium neglectum TaxID=145388 RepID=A0A0D2N368_9CHLO|nr:hypothetical protein MNEG_1119 [Monoraphidium neglectum]KIZ06832.1 hypothetical protein MNEG_1119 [Monoraphidium neglectum]|eukprot:XP_013905851.1 hypothetical protein MNEG_1119 [Monoraphidium neglectum]